MFVIKLRLDDSSPTIRMSFHFVNPLTLGLRLLVKQDLFRTARLLSFKHPVIMFNKTFLTFLAVQTM